MIRTKRPRHLAILSVKSLGLRGLEEGLSVELVRVGLDGEGSILVEAAPGAGGPMKAGRVGAAITELPTTLSAALEPVVEAARTVLGQLRNASPATVEVEFGVDLAVEAGVVITKTAANSHLKVTLTWSRSASGQEEA